MYLCWVYVRLSVTSYHNFSTAVHFHTCCLLWQTTKQRHCVFTRWLIVMSDLVAWLHVTNVKKFFLSVVLMFLATLWHYCVAAKATYIRFLHGKIGFFFGGGGFGPSSVTRGRTHIMLDEICSVPPPLHTLKIWGAGVNSPRSYSAEFVSFYVAAKATYIRLLHGKIGILEGFFGPSSVHMGRTHIVLG